MGPKGGENFYILCRTFDKVVPLCGKNFLYGGGWMRAFQAVSWLKTFQEWRWSYTIVFCSAFFMAEDLIVDSDDVSTYNCWQLCAPNFSLSKQSSVSSFITTSYGADTYTEKDVFVTSSLSLSPCKLLNRKSTDNSLVHCAFGNGFLIPHILCETPYFYWLFEYFV